MRMIKKLMLMTMIMTELKPVLKMFQGDGLVHKGWLAIEKLKPLSLFISLLSMPKKAFDNVKIDKR